MKVLDAVEGWFVVRAPRKDAANTTKAYRLDLDSILVEAAAVLAVAPAAIDVTDLDLHTMRLAFGRWAKSRSSASVRRCHSTWSGFFEYLVSEDLVPGSPMPGVGRPKAPRRQPKPFSEGDAERIVRAVQAGVVGRRNPWPEMDRAIVLAFVLTGARAGELLAANIGDVTLTAGNERIRLVGKGGVERNVPMPAAMLVILAAYLTSRRARFPESGARKRGVSGNADEWAWWRPDAPLFVDRHGERMRPGALTYLVTLVYREAGVEASRPAGALVHALRHTAATRLVENGATAVQLMEFLGHQSLQTSQGYVTATAESVREVAALNPAVGLLETTN